MSIPGTMLMGEGPGWWVPHSLDGGFGATLRPPPPKKNLMFSVGY